MAKLFRIVSILAFACFLAASVFASANFDSGEKVPARLKWNAKEITIAVSSSMSTASPSILRGSDVEGAIRRSLATWEAAADVRFRIVNSDRLTVSPSGVRGDGVNLITIAPTPDNIILFARDPDAVSASTRVFYKRKSITEADIVLNPYQLFSTDGAFGTYDLESTLTHEIGHLLGLSHSSFPGSTMFENYGRNGMFGMPNLGARTLSALDIAAVTALYGAVNFEENCCSAFTADITADSRGAVWLEDAETGKLVRGSTFDKSGVFDLGSLPEAEYRLYLQAENAPAEFETVDLGTSDLKRIKLADPLGAKAGLRFVGLNGELAAQSISLNSGRTYRIYVGGVGFDQANVRIGIDSPFFTVEPDTQISHDYGKTVNVMSVEIRVSPDVPAGLYSVYIETDKDGRYFLPGSLSVEPFPNPWGRINSPVR
jgi:hypothetical protein